MVGADEHEPPTYYSFEDIKERSVGRRLTELPLACRFGADLVFYETETSRAERAALYGMDELRRTFHDPPLPVTPESGTSGSLVLGPA